jgi:menaquinol-cytochrome c reductase iron-sulfur subunit
MSDNKTHEAQGSDVRQKAKKEMSRRQFLTYTLGGTGGFLAAAMLVPMVRFAVDPILQPKVKADWVKVVEVAKITDTPASFKFQIHQVDGWYESDPELEAWISKEADGSILALNPTCKHLGCTVKWAGDPDHKDQYACPCHGAHYTKEGRALRVAKLPLDQYTVKSENGFIYVGQLHANEIAK